jgi:SAM-dependent methyltransferase
MSSSDDIFGAAFAEFLTTDVDEPIEVWINGELQDPLPPSYFFRSYDDMPDLEQIGLACCGKKVLDVGAAAGCHSLWLQEHGHDVVAVEISPLACDVMRKRGVNQVVCTNFFDLEPEPVYDTVLLLMNGLGMGQDVQGTIDLLQHAAKFLKPGGDIVGDSSDIAYFYEDEDVAQKKGLSLQPPFDHYYGKVHFKLKWKDVESDFRWIYPDPRLLAFAAEANQLDYTVVAEGPHHDYLCAFRHQR